MFLLGLRKEHMSNQLMGPSPYPDLYSPTYKYPRPRRHSVSHADEIGPNRPPEDDGTHRSDTATRQYSVYFYKPFGTLPFPTSPPPQPYLNDFKVFQR